ncbi:MAG: hypothetical protein HUU25_15405 [Candidatus Sumerlaeia bacterium]|nr:hypothetical protein [Candidatus Sumerlaeia bacterium]
MARKVVALLALSVASAQAEDRFVGVAFNTSPLFTYSVNSSGEIALESQTAQTTFGELIRVDPGGRFVVTFRSPDELDLWRIGVGGLLTLEASAEPEAPRELTQDVALSPDSRILLALTGDPTLPRGDPLRFDFRTFHVNNRLEMDWSGASWAPPGGLNLSFDPFLWAISERLPYTALLSLSSQQLAVLSISATGEITDTGQRLATPGLLNVPFDISPDGRWAISGGNTDVVLFEIHPDGTVTLEDTFDPNGPAIGPNCLRFTPNLNQILIAPLVDTVESLAFDETTLLGSVIDSAETGFGLPEALAVNAAGTMVLVDDQTAGGQFSLASVFLRPDGTLTPTGHTLPKGFKLADLQFIPPRALPSLPGDANLDGVVDAADIVFLVNEALPDDKPILYPPNFANADLDQDVDVDQDDLEALVQLLVGE